MVAAASRVRGLSHGPSPTGLRRDRLYRQGRTDAVLKSQSGERFDRVDDALWVVGRRCVPATPTHTQPQKPSSITAAPTRREVTEEGVNNAQHDGVGRYGGGGYMRQLATRLVGIRASAS